MRKFKIHRDYDYVDIRLEMLNNCTLQNKMDTRFGAEGNESETRRFPFERIRNWTIPFLKYFIPYVLQSTIVKHFKVNIYIMNKCCVNLTDNRLEYM